MVSIGYSKGVRQWFCSTTGPQVSRLPGRLAAPSKSSGESEGGKMTDYTTDVTVTIHGTEIELIAVGGEICPAEPDVGIM